MFILYFVLWVILNGRWTMEIGAFGLVFAAAAYVFSCMFMGYSLRYDLALLRRLPDAIRYLVLLFREIIAANAAVIRMILDKGFEPKPQLVCFDAPLEKERHRVALANSITLTPGTITVSLQDKRYMVHCLDTSLAEGLDDSTLLRALEAIEHPDVPAQDEAPAEEMPDMNVPEGSEPGGDAAQTGDHAPQGDETPEDPAAEYDDAAQTEPEKDEAEKDEAEKEETADA